MCLEDSECCNGKRQQYLLETFQKQKSARVDEECSVSESHRSEECSNSEFDGFKSDIDLFETIDSNSRMGAAASDQAVSQASLSHRTPLFPNNSINLKVISTIMIAVLCDSIFETLAQLCLFLSFPGLQ